MNRRSILTGIAALTAAACLAPLASAQDRFPNKPVRVLVGFAPGGSTDMLARFLAKELGDKFKQPFIVENKPGANTVLAGQELLAHPADGYTLAVFENTTPTIAPFLLKKRPYDPLGFQPITKLVDIPQALMVPANSPMTSLKDFVARAKSDQSLSFGSPGSGGAAFLQFAGFLNEADLKVTHVPYKGAAPAVQDLIAGHVPSASFDVATAQQHVMAGKVRMLAVATPERLAILPDVPTYKELGYKSQSNSPWFGLFTKAGTPRSTIDQLNAALQEIAASAAFKEWAAARTLVVTPSKTPEEFAKLVNSNMADFSRVIDKLGLAVD